MKLDTRMFPEAETIQTQEVINTDIELGTTLEGHALQHESNDLSTGYASWHPPNILYHGHALQQEPIRSGTETVPEGHASHHTPRRPRTPSESKKRKKWNKN